MAFDKVIVFGPTGNIGSITAQTASKKGANVFLAMRDPSKTIPGLSQEAEQSGKYERVQADLTDRDSILAAVKKTGAQAAFVYLAHGSPDHMLSTFQSLKEGGIKHVVFLSSFTVPKENLEGVPASDLISWLHAQAELSLRSVFSQDQLVAIRPGFFATNVLQNKPGILERKVHLLSPDSPGDCITNEDMGEVAGTVLTEGQREGQDVIYLFGPEIVPQSTAFKLVGKVLGEEIEVLKVSAEEAEAEKVRGGVPPPIAKYLTKVYEEMEGKDAEGWGVDPEKYKEGSSNVQKYTGHPGLSFETWAGRNKSMFT